MLLSPPPPTPPERQHSICQCGLDTVCAELVNLPTCIRRRVACDFQCKHACK